MVAKGFTLGPREESECEMGIVLEADGYFGKIDGVEPIGVACMEMAPTILGTMVGED